jgi:hypothetical protein
MLGIGSLEDGTPASLRGCSNHVQPARLLVSVKGWGICRFRLMLLTATLVAGFNTSGDVAME